MYICMTHNMLNHGKPLYYYFMSYIIHISQDTLQSSVDGQGDYLIASSEQWEYNIFHTSGKWCAPEEERKVSI